MGNSHSLVRSVIQRVACVLWSVPHGTPDTAKHLGGVVAEKLKNSGATELLKAQGSDR